MWDMMSADHKPLHRTGPKLQLRCSRRLRCPIASTFLEAQGDVGETWKRRPSNTTDGHQMTSTIIHTHPFWDSLMLPRDRHWRLKRCGLWRHGLKYNHPRPGSWGWPKLSDCPENKDLKMLKSLASSPIITNPSSCGGSPGSFAAVPLQ